MLSTQRLCLAALVALVGTVVYEVLLNAVHPFSTIIQLCLVVLVYHSKHSIQQNKNLMRAFRVHSKITVLE